MRHYFINTDVEKKHFSFHFNYDNKAYKFNSSTDVFSKNEVDEGSMVLTNAIIKKIELFGDVLDMGCGYGTISILLQNYFNANFYLCDINEHAVELAKQNAQLNNSKNIKQIFVSDMFSAINQEFDFIVSNPPIKSGKKKLNEFLENSIKYLRNKGSIIIVIKKNLGAKSAKQKLTDVFGNCIVVKRDAGYYVLQSTKNA